MDFAGQNVVYVLRSITNPNLFYVGYTNNIERRIRQHNGLIAGGGKYTSTNRPWELACLIFCAEKSMDKSEALRVEYWAKAKNHPDKSPIPKHCPVVKRIWLIKYATQKLDRQCSISVYDPQIAQLW